MKKLQTLFVVLMMVLILGFLSTNVLAALPAYTLNADSQRPFSDNNNGTMSDGPGGIGEQAYAINKEDGRHIVYKIGEVIPGQEKLDFSKALFCLRHGVGFGEGGETRTIDFLPTMYGLLGNMKTDREAIINYYNTAQHIRANLNQETTVTVNGTRYTFVPYNSILWLIDNMALIKGPNPDMTKINKMLEDAGIAISNTETENLTIDDIDVIEQAALWFFSNYDEEFLVHEGAANPLSPSLKISIKEFTNTIDLIRDEDAWGTLTRDFGDTRGEKADKLYTYLIENAIKNGDTASNNNEVAEPTVVLAGTNAKVKEESISLPNYEGDFYVVGPFTLNITGKENWDIELTPRFSYKKSSNDADFTSISNTTILEQNGDAYRPIRNLISVSNGTNFYIAIEKANIQGSIVEFKLEVDYTYQRGARTAELYIAEGASQPVLYIKEEPVSGNGSAEATVDNKIADFALRKYITAVNEEELTGRKIRTPRLNNEDIAKILENGTADYRHLKVPVEVMPGDFVTYTITVYNEGPIAGKITEIVDHLPEGLTLDAEKTNALANGEYTAEQTGTDITIAISKDYTLAAFNGTDLESYSVQVVCKVSDTLTQEDGDTVLTNVAQITDFETETGKKIDRDSRPENDTFTNLSTYWGARGQSETKPGATSATSYYKGQEDDDDFEKVFIKGVNFDLSLRKFISSVKRGEKEILEESREPMVDVAPLQNGAKTAEYTHPKIDKPVVVKNGDIITYTIRVYNEGDVDGYANLIVDHIPEGLEFLVDSEVNQKYLWGYKDRDLKAISTRYWAKGNEHVGEQKDGKILAYDGGDYLDYRDVQIEFKVIAPNTYTGNIVNIAEIAESVAVNENNDALNVKDRDNKALVDLTDYDLKTAPENSEYQEDDDDYEVVQLRYFDLALRKFITAVNDEAITSRIPEARWNDETEQVEYIHPKDPVLVSNADIVTYTIRVFNEGVIAGYAEEVADDIPVGLIFLPEHEINTAYRWKMVDANGNETTNVADAVRVETDYLSEAHGETMKENHGDENPNLLRPFDFDRPVSNDPPFNPDYRDIKIAFKVDQSALDDPETIIINHAQITDDSDDDEDSTPDYWGGEDDEDIERIRVRIFDLSLQKWVTHTVVTVDGETTVVETGFRPNVGHTDQDGRPNSENEPIAQVVIDKKKLDRTTVKFIYAIKVANEGEIPGYATEITDYIPEGLMFVQEDNPLWEPLGEDRVITHALETDEIAPGDSRVLEIVFTWINDENNLGVKRNIAAITDDYNEYGDTPDKDSTPGNTNIPQYEREQEDDDDFALVVLTLKTGGERTYVAITLLVLAIIATGTFFIKRFVLQ